MNGPSFVVLPVSGDSSQHTNQETAESKSATTLLRLPSLNTYIVFLFFSCFSSSTCAIRKNTPRTRTIWTIQADLRYRSTHASNEGNRGKLIFRTPQLTQIASISTSMLVLTKSLNGKLFTNMSPVGGSNPHFGFISRWYKHPIRGTLPASHSTGSQGRGNHSWTYVTSTLHDRCNKHISNSNVSVVSVTEFASRSFSTDSLSTRLRPKDYKKIPEPALNATLKDIHDFIQYAVVQAQRIVFGQDLDKTFAVSCISL